MMEGLATLGLLIGIPLGYALGRRGATMVHAWRVMGSCFLLAFVAARFAAALVPVLVATGIALYVACIAASVGRREERVRRRRQVERARTKSEPILPGNEVAAPCVDSARTPDSGTFVGEAAGVHAMGAVVVCPHCGMRVIANANGECPSCRHSIDPAATVATPPVTPLDSGGELEMWPMTSPRDVLVIGRAPSMTDLVGSAFLIGFLSITALAGEGDPLAYAGLGLAVLVLFRLCWTPRAAVDAGELSMRTDSSWRTPATNVAALELQRGRTMFTFRDVDAVEPARRRAGFSRVHRRHGYHVASRPGAFSPQQVDELRSALGWPPSEPDALSSFEARLDELSPRVVVTPVLIAVNAIVFLSMVLVNGVLRELESHLMIEWGANAVALTTSGQWWRFLVPAHNLIGRHPACHVYLPEFTASRWHAQIDME